MENSSRLVATFLATATLAGASELSNAAQYSEPEAAAALEERLDKLRPAIGSDMLTDGLAISQWGNWDDWSNGWSKWRNW